MNRAIYKRDGCWHEHIEPVPNQDENRDGPLLYKCCECGKVGSMDDLGFDYW